MKKHPPMLKLWRTRMAAIVGLRRPQGGTHRLACPGSTNLTPLRPSRHRQCNALRAQIHMLTRPKPILPMGVLFSGCARGFFTASRQPKSLSMNRRTLTSPLPSPLSSEWERRVSSRRTPIVPQMPDRMKQVERFNTRMFRESLPTIRQ